MFDGVIKENAVRQPEEEGIRQKYRKDKLGMSR
jgi:hypothetical protein